MNSKNFADLENVEIFRVGTWNGDTYTSEDLDNMVNNFQALKTEQSVPIKLGHDENQKLLQKDGYPSAGWITSVKRVGDKLLASAKDVPQAVYDLIRSGAYKKVSSEIYPTFKDATGNVHKTVLRAIALLGSDVPAVQGLADIQAMYEDSQEYRSYVTAPKMSFIITKHCSDKKELHPTRKELYTVPERQYNRKFQNQYDEALHYTMETYDLSRDEATIKIHLDSRKD
jgi:hypothetical protein